MNTYLFLFGRSPELSIAELEATVSHFPDCHVTQTSGSYALVSCESRDVAGQLFFSLGGAVKLAEVLKQVSYPDVSSAIVEYLKGLSPHHLFFGVTSLSKDFSSKTVCREVKEGFNGTGTRFFYAGEEELTPSQTVKSGLLKDGYEFILAPHEETIIIARVLNVYDFESFAVRDSQRPFPNPKRGMLPPRVARMMVNLIRPYVSQNGTVLDPFCGVGTIVAEAGVLGFYPYGNDLSFKAVEASRKNIAWLGSALHVPIFENYDVSRSIVKGDAVHLSTLFKTERFDAIVTEPFMGPLLTQIPTPGELERTMSGLERLYKGFLKEARKVLKKDGVIVMIFPQFRVNQEGKKPIVRRLRIIDTLTALGYNVVNGPFIYAREGAYVERSIYILKLV